MPDAASFNALNGAEALTVIVNKIRSELERTGEFRENITFPLLKFKAQVQVWGYPKDDLNGKPGVDLEYVAGEAEGDPSIKVNIGDVVDTPDKSRLENNIPIPVAQPSAKGIITDVPTRIDGPTKRSESLSEAIAAKLKK